jgi:hypothetical protein
MILTTVETEHGPILASLRANQGATHRFNQQSKGPRLDTGDAFIVGYVQLSLLAIERDRGADWDGWVPIDPEEMAQVMPILRFKPAQIRKRLAKICKAGVLDSKKDDSRDAQLYRVTPEYLDIERESMEEERKSMEEATE